MRKILLFERPFRVHQQDHHFGEANGVERVGVVVDVLDHVQADHGVEAAVELGEDVASRDVGEGHVEVRTIGVQAAAASAGRAG